MTKPGNNLKHHPRKDGMFLKRKNHLSNPFTQAGNAILFLSKIRLSTPLNSANEGNSTHPHHNVIFN